MCNPRLFFLLSGQTAQLITFDSMPTVQLAV